jgi:PEP-CTERM motif
MGSVQREHVALGDWRMLEWTFNQWAAGLLAAMTCALAFSAPVHGGGGYLEFGNENVLGTGTYASDPKAGATLVGLAPNVVTMASLITPHGYPFSPAPGDFQGTDQIYVGSVQTAFDDGYSQYSGRLNGPDVLTMNFSSLVPAGQTVATVTLGIAADDFQNPVFGNPFTATINGTTDAGLSSELNSLNETGPVVRFFTIGIDPSLLSGSQVLTLSINEGGTGGDGYAIDFLTVGVTLQSVPEPSSLVLLGVGAFVAFIFRQRRNR